MPRVNQLDNEPKNKNNGNNKSNTTYTDRRARTTQTTAKTTQSTAKATQSTGRAKNTTTTPKTTVQDRKTTPAKTPAKTTSVKANTQTVNANVNTFDLAGTNQAQNGLKTEVKREEGKTFVPEIPDAKDSNEGLTYANLVQNQDVLSSMADDSSRKAQDVVNKIGTTFQAVKGMAKAYTDTQRKAKEERYYQANEERMSVADKQRDEYISSFTQEDYDNSFNQDGTLKDFGSILKEDKKKIDYYKSIVNLQTTGQVEGQQQYIDDARKELERLQKEYDYYSSLDKKINAISEKNMLDSFLAEGNEEEYRRYRDMFSHSEDTTLERFGTLQGKILTEFVNTIPSAVDQTVLASKYGAVNEKVDEIEAMHNSGDIDDKTYAEAMKYYDEYIQKAENDYYTGVSQTIQQGADMFSNNAYYNTSEIQQFMLQAGESTEQFLIHYLTGKAVASLFSSEEALRQAGESVIADSISEGITGGVSPAVLETELAKYSPDKIIQIGANALGGKNATLTMALSSKTSRFNQLIEQGVDPMTANNNSWLYGGASWGVETLGMERVVKLLSIPATTDIIGYQLLSNVVSEGLEENAEDIVDKMIDSATLGTPFELDPKEMLTEFLLASASSLMISGGASAINVGSQAIDVQKALNARRDIRESVINQASEMKFTLAIKNRQEYDLAKNAMEVLERNVPDMSPEQLDYFAKYKKMVDAGISAYEQMSQTTGIVFPSEEVMQFSKSETNEAVVGAMNPDINEDIKAKVELDDAQSRIENNFAQMEQNELDYLTATQLVLNQSGYGDIDAYLFNNMDEKKKNEALIASDLGKLVGLNINVTNSEGIKNAILENNPELSEAELNDIVASTNGIIVSKNRIYIDSTKRSSILSTLVHELTHGTESSKYYQKLKDVVVKSLGDKWNSMVEAKADAYDEIQDFDSEEARRDNAEREVVAEFIESRLNDEGFIDELVKYDQSIAHRLLQNIQSIGNTDETARLKKAFKMAFTSAEALKTVGGEAIQMSYKENSQIISAQRELLDTNINKLVDQFKQEGETPQQTEARVREMFEKAFNQMETMADLMRENSSILPTEVIGNVLLKDASYGYSVENATVCPRTLAYNELTNYVADKVGRPLTAIESFLVSQKLYSIAVEPQCLYCYVALDRKSYNEFVGRYIDQRDEMLRKYTEAGSPKVGSSEYQKLYEEFLGGRKDTRNMRRRFDGWISAYNNGDKLLTKYDVRNDWSRQEIEKNGGSDWTQLKDMLNYAQMASWAKKSIDYRAYFDDIRKMSQKVVDELNKHYGLRWYSFNDYTPAYILENMQQFTDASLRGLMGLAYTKDVDFARIFAPTGVNINISMYVTTDKNGNYMIDPVQSANWKEAIEVRNQYKNVGIVVTGTSFDSCLWALQQDWSDVVIPFHIVRTGSDIAQYYKWSVFNSEQNDVVNDKNLWEGYVESLTGVPRDSEQFKKASKKASKMIYPSEHHNDLNTYLNLCDERGLKPRFSSFLEAMTDEDGNVDPRYMKLVNETRQSDLETEYLKPEFDMDSAEVSFENFREKGGYFGGWWKDGVELDREANDVANDVFAFERGDMDISDANYGQGYVDFDEYTRMLESRKKAKGKGKHGLGNIQYSFKTASDVANETSWDEFKDKTRDREFVGVLKENGIKTAKNMREFWVNQKMKSFTSNDAYEISREDAVSIVRENIPSNILDGWFRNADSSYKEKLETLILENDDLRNAGLNLAYDNYKAVIDSDISFDEFLNKELTLYRGVRGQTTVGEDVFLAYTYDEKTARQFGSNVKTISIKPIDTLGSYQTSSETEILVPTGSTEFKTGDIQYSKTNGSDFTASEAQEIEDNILSISDDQIPMKTVKLDSKTLDKNKIAQVLRDMPEVKTEEGKWKRNKEMMNHEFLDHLDRIVELSKEYKNPQIEALADYAMMAQARANEAIANKRYEFVIDGKKSKAVEKGESLNDIIGDLSRDQIQTLGDYLYNWRNVDHMTRVERLGKEYNGVKVKNTSVFTKGQGVTADESRERIAEIENENPWVKEKAERLWEFSRQNLKMLLDAGIVSKDTYDYYQKATPHYIPIQRNVEGGLGVQQLDPNKADLKFKGSSEDILPLDHNLIAHTQKVYNTVAQNKLHNEIMNTVGNLEEMTPDEMEDVFEASFNPLSVDEKTGKRMYAYKNGKKFSMPVDDRLYDSLAPLQKRGKEFKTLQNINNFRRNLITGWNPLFAITNMMKDLQDAVFNTKHPLQFRLNYAEAWRQILGKGEFYKLYRSAGGGMNSYVDEFGKSKDIKADERGIYDILENINDKTLKKAWSGLIAVNKAIETAPRLAEFMVSLKNGSTLEQAMLDASEVTTNFKRGGDTAKYLNRNGMAFFNASLQGYRRQLRNIQDAKDGGVKGMLTFMAKAVLTSGFQLALLNHMMWKDDDDYEELSDYVKNNYYIVAKYGDGKFIRIPKGRISAFYQTVMKNTKLTLEGKVKLWDAMMDDLTSFMDNIAPNNPWENFIAKPLIDAKNNKTWYGGDLVPSRLQDVPDSEQYDESTDELSKAIGRLSKKVADATGADFLELSPKKINYVLDQYSGAIGDIVLPALTPAITQESKVPFVNAVLDKFTTDPILKNQNVTDLYSLRDEVTKRANSLNATDEEKLSSKYLYSISSEMGELYGKKREIQADTSLSTKEKFDKVREIQKQINELAKVGLANYDQIDVTGNYATVGDVQYYKTADGQWRKPSKSQLKNVQGISDEDKDGYFQTFGEISDIRDEIKANTPEGQKANYTDATIEAIRNSNMSASGKNALLDSYYNSKTSQHINDMGWSDEKKFDVKVAVQKAEGQKDENGKTISNSKAEVVAEIYRQQGVLDDVLQYIKDNNIEPSEMGLSKTVYKNLTGSSSKKKSSSSSKKKTSSKSSKTSSGGKSIKASGGSSIKKVNLVSNPMKETKPNLKRYFNAYQSVFGNGSKKVSTGGSQTVTCPNCGNSVSSSTGRCPICGANL